MSTENNQDPSQQLTAVLSAYDNCLKAPDNESMQTFDKAMETMNAMLNDRSVVTQLNNERPRDVMKLMKAKMYHRQLKDNNDVLGQQPTSTSRPNA